MLAAVVIVGLVATGCSGSGTIKQANAGARAGTGFVVRELPGENRKYGVFVPHGYDGTKAYPVILFLHGAFEGGDNPGVAFSVGLGDAIADKAANFDYIAVFPQTRSGNWKESNEDLGDAYKALQDVKKNYRVDNDRVVLSGLSIGGYGVWALAKQYPNEFAALVPMCGYDKLDAVPAVKGIPTWVFHNTMDPFVGVGDSKVMVEAINKAGGNAKLTTYGAVGHDVWKRAYREPELWRWLAQQRRSGASASAR
jgi:predicted peptidase